MSGSYCIRAECGNCGNSREYEIPKGIEVYETECGDCECKTLRPLILTIWGGTRNFHFQDGPA